MTTPDYATWLTKQQAAEAIGVTPKTIERMAQAGQIQQTHWRRPTGGPELAVYQPDDVARIASERRRDPLPAFLVPAAAVRPTNGNGHNSTALAIAPAGGDHLLGPGDNLLRAVVTAAAQVMSETSQTSTLYLTVDEAAGVLNWTARDLRRAIRGGEVPCRNKERRDWRTWRIRRKDLEGL